MRLLLSLPLLSLVAAAPRQSSSNSLTQWGEALGRWSAWYQMSAPPPQEVVRPMSFYDENKNIYQRLKEAGEYKKLLKIIDMNSDVRDCLEDNNRKMTLLAPNDEAFEYFLDGDGMFEDDKDRDDKKRREWRRKLGEQFVLYHIIDRHVLEYNEFGRNSTLATALRPKDGAFADLHRRVKVQSQVNGVRFNNYATISQRDIRAKNGVIQKIDRPLIPPPDIMDQLYMMPRMFAFSAVGFLKVDLQDELEYNSNQQHLGQGHNDRDRDGGKTKRGYGATTTIVPSNQAWEKLPRDLQFYLFSPFGERALRKLLEFHTIPDYLVFTEYVEKDKVKGGHDEPGRRPRRDDMTCEESDKDDESFEWERKFPTLYKRQDIEIRSKKTRRGANEYNWDFCVHGIEVDNYDNPAQNGAIHMVNTVLSPRSKSGHNEQQTQKDWEQWKDWFLDWVEDKH